MWTNLEEEEAGEMGEEGAACSACLLGGLGERVRLLRLCFVWATGKGSLRVGEKGPGMLRADVKLDVGAFT